jgi:hypothetical protein
METAYRYVLIIVLVSFIVVALMNYFTALEKNPRNRKGTAEDTKRTTDHTDSTDKRRILTTKEHIRPMVCGHEGEEGRNV